MGDYCSGPNHTLPTHGYARAFGGLSLEDFQKRITVQELSPAGLIDLGPTAEILAHLEGLDAPRRGGEHAARGDREAAAGTAVVSLARPEIVTLKPYAHAAWRPTLTRLHANEAPWRPAGDPTAGRPQPLSRAAARTPDSGSWPRSTALPEESVLATRGSDEAIDLLSRIYLRAGTDAILQCSPSFGMYQVAARIQGADSHRGAPRTRARLGPRSGTAAGGLAARTSSSCTCARRTIRPRICSMPPPWRISAERSTARPSS